jgi:PAS domain S-box-containing protein
MVAILLLFPGRVSMAAINTVALPLVIFYPLGGLVVSAFMLRQRTIYFGALEIKDREQEYKDLFNQSASYSFLIDPITGRIDNVNQAAISRYGFTYEELKRMTIYDLSTFSKKEILRLEDQVTKGLLPYITIKHVLKNKEIMDVAIRNTNITIEGLTFVYATITDITSRLQGEQKYEDVNTKLKATLHSVSEGVISTNEYGEIELINNIAREYLATKDKVTGKNIIDVVKIYSKDNDINFEELFNDKKSIF